MSRLAVEKARELHECHPGMSIPVEIESLAEDEGCELIDWPFLEPVKEVKQGRFIGIASGLVRWSPKFGQVVKCGFCS